jgi:drug/metabolite transporter (DMT)-like permease
MKVAQFALLCLIWGSTWLVIKVGYGGLGPFNVASLRFFAAGMALALVTPLVGARWPRRPAQWALVAWVGVLLFAGDYGLIYWGEQYLPSGVTAILFAILPLVTIAMAHVYVPGERMTGRKLAGSLTAFLGIVVIFGDQLRVDSSTIGPMIAIVGAAFCAAAANVVAKRHAALVDSTTLNASAMLLGAVVLLLASVASGGGVRLPTELSVWLAVGYLSIVGSVVAFLVYFSLMKTWSVTSLSFLGVFMPVVALALGAIVLHEPVTPSVIAGAALILAGVTLTLRQPAVMPRPARVEPETAAPPQRGR